MPSSSQWCAFHAERHGFARCMSCAKTLCQECATQWDGIWHCAGCLGNRRRATVERSPLFSWLAVLSVSALLLFAGARLMVWTAAAFAGLF